MKFLNKLKIKNIRKKFNLSPEELNWYELKKQGLEKNKDKIETLFLGSSHGDIGINTNAIPDCKGYNLCFGSQDLYYSYELYKKYADFLPNLKNICLTYSVFSSGYELQKTINKRFTYYYKHIFDIDFKYSPEFGSCEKELAFINRFVNVYLPKGFTGYKESISPFNYDIALRDVKAHLKNAFRNNNQEIYVQKISELAKEKGHNLYVIIPPHSPEYRKQSKKEALNAGYDYDKKFEKLYDLKVKILNYYNNENFSDDDFMDWEHLIPSGASKFTNIFINDTINKS